MSELYRIPVDEPNYSQVLETPIDLTDSSETPTTLRQPGEVRLWGVRSGTSNERLYEELAPGDGLLFYLGKNYRDGDNGAYVGIGRVKQKVRCSKEFASLVLKNEHATHLYTVADFQSIHASPSKIESLLGYSSHPQGAHRVREDRYRSVEKVFSSLANQRNESAAVHTPDQSTQEQIIENARNGNGPCQGCVAHTSGNSRLVNPGLAEYSADIMFVTEEPKHAVNWDEEDSWQAWNERFMRGFDGAPGGKYIEKLLEPMNLSLNDVWIADSLKCPTEAHDQLETVDVDTSAAFGHCKKYLDEELREVDPDLIVALGNEASERVLDVLGVEASIHTKKSDYGRVFDTHPPVIVSPHWSAYNWMSTEDTELRIEAVKTAISEVFGKLSA